MKRFFKISQAANGLRLRVTAFGNRMKASEDSGGTVTADLVDEPEQDPAGHLQDLEFDYSALVKIQDTKQYGGAHYFPVTHGMTARSAALLSCGRCMILSGVRFHHL